MPKFHYRIEQGNAGGGSYVLDLDDGSLATASLKFAARHLAAQHVESGSLDLSHSILLEDAEGRVLVRRPLGDFVSVAHCAPEEGPPHSVA